MEHRCKAKRFYILEVRQICFWMNFRNLGGEYDYKKWMYKALIFNAHSSKKPGLDNGRKRWLVVLPRNHE